MGHEPLRVRVAGRAVCRDTPPTSSEAVARCPARRCELTSRTTPVVGTKSQVRGRSGQSSTSRRGSSVSAQAIHSPLALSVIWITRVVHPFSGDS